MKRLIPLLWFFVCVLPVSAQIDSVQLLQEATVVENRYQELSKVQYQFKDDSIAHLLAPIATVAEWLQQESSIQVRQYAPGAVASFSARGANSSQSAIMWSGFNLNSSATGITDLSVLPMEQYNVSMLRGGSAASFGSGAIGGVLQLHQSNTGNKGVHASILQQIASFKTFKSSANISVKTNHFTSVTRLYHEQSENDFPFTNTWTKPEIEETRKHAAYHQTHLAQLFSFRLNDNQRLEAEGWINWANRNTPNSAIASTGTAVLTDRYFRSRAGWFYAKNNIKADVQYAYLHESQIFEDPNIIESPNGHLIDTNITKSHIFQANYEWRLNAFFQWQNGFMARYDEVSGSNRSGNQETASLQSGLVFNRLWLQAQAIIRAETWEGKVLPLSPFASVRADFLEHFFASAYTGYVYRIPTLNDRFWVPGGNINLNPEQGWTTEFALGYKQTVNAFSFDARVSGYYSLLDNYIQWIPGIGGVWSPENVKKVEIFGADVNASTTYSFNKWYAKLTFGGSLNSSTIVESESSDEHTIGQQLVYQPKSKTNYSATLGYSTWYVKTYLRNIGAVSTNYLSGSNGLPAYHIIDLSVTKAISIKKVCASISFAVNNITNQTYQNIAYYPMPGRNYSLTLKFNI